jgi:iron complex outermembrane receptor protein
MSPYRSARTSGFAIATYIAITSFAGGLEAQETKPADKDTTVKLGAVKVTAESPVIPLTPMLRLTLPVSAEVTATKVEQTINIVDTEDAVKYLPSVFMRKRNYGDTQAVLGTRVWGVSGSARSLVFADGVPLTALVGNNNSFASPQWGMVAPDEISRIDMMYGPYSAAYSGSSMGAVMEIVTRMPTKLEGSVDQTWAQQSFNLYGTNGTFPTSQTTANIGDRFGAFAFWASANYQDSHSQPLSFVTAGSLPSNTAGGITATNKLGAAADVLGASGMLHTNMTNAKLKLAYDITRTLRASYTYGYWNNHSNSGDDTYLTATNASNAATYAGVSGFASGVNTLAEQRSAQSLALRTDSRGHWDFELTGSVYRYNTDKQLTPTTASATGASLAFAAPGKAALFDGTGWSTLDVKETWRPDGVSGAHAVTVGAHQDDNRLYNPTYNTPDWTTGATYSSVATEGDGRTRTQAIWAQDAWQLRPTLKLTYGGRWESYRAYDGYNVNGATKINQPELTASRFSPKVALAWTASPEWTITTSVGQAYRFATPAELYQLVTTGATFTSPNPTLKPENVLAGEIAIARHFERGLVQVTLFGQDVHDAMIAQYLPLVPNSQTLYSYTSNVDHVLAKGAELVLGSNDVLVNGLDFNFNATYLDARTVAITGAPSATATPASAIGKMLPNIPDWRATFVTTYHATEGLAFTLAGRYSGKIFTTLDNSDVNPNVYQGFSAWFVADAKADWRFNRHWTGSLGVDNLLDRKYFFFHPFPMRTVVTSLKYTI